MHLLVLITVKVKLGQSISVTQVSFLFSLASESCREVFFSLLVYHDSADFISAPIVSCQANKDADILECTPDDVLMLTD